MKIVLPKQHGAWAMLLMPFLLGIILGEPTWLHIPAFIGWLMLYLATYPLLMLFKKKQPKKALYKKWFSIYICLALIMLLIPIIYIPRILLFGLAMLPFFLINAYYSKRNRDRAFMNDLSAIAAFSIGGIVSYYIGIQSLNEVAIAIFSYSFLFFCGSAFFVKTSIREKRNPTFIWISWIYHIGVIVITVLIGMPFVALAFLPSVIRAIYFTKKPMTPKQIGVLEIVNSSYFLIIMSLLLPALEML